MEKIVLNKLDTLLPMYPNCCKCEECKRDIAILALNHLPPKYISTDKGRIFMQIEETDTQYDAEVIQEVAKAINIIENNPRHEKKV
jgi:competence protein ComFB